MSLVWSTVLLPTTDYSQSPCSLSSLPRLSSPFRLTGGPPSSSQSSSGTKQFTGPFACSSSSPLLSISTPPDCSAAPSVLTSSRLCHRNIVHSEPSTPPFLPVCWLSCHLTLGRVPSLGSKSLRARFARFLRTILDTGSVHHAAAATTSLSHPGIMDLLLFLTAIAVASLR